ncbi:MAG: GIY-YIG nuclease family protein [Candidatus Magasanikbacteria bacterium]
MYTVYILESQKTKRYYIGHCQDLSVRLSRHNSGKVKSTKAYLPWRVIHTEEIETRSDAYKREMQIKRYKGGNAFKQLIRK